MYNYIYTYIYIYIILYICPQVHLSLVQHCLLYILQTMVLSVILSLILGGAGLANFNHFPPCPFIPFTNEPFLCSQLRWVTSTGSPRRCNGGMSMHLWSSAPSRAHDHLVFTSAEKLCISWRLYTIPTQMVPAYILDPIKHMHMSVRVGAFPLSEGCI